jgi:polysaccharide deacetylase family protein (PEP-CTERM system associated)
MNQQFHLLTVDVEDWPQSTLDHSLPIGERVLANTHAVLDLLAEAKVQATFFVLGKVAEAHPGLAREIVTQGHEVGSHGYSHDSIEQMSRARFSEELHRSIEVLKQQTGRAVTGHRAADFSISRYSLDLLECLGDEGLLYDSSIFPIRHPRYGIPEAPRKPHLVRCASKSILIEFPLATVKLARATLPVAGGGYLRLFPYWITRFALRRLHEEGSVATCYIHPYELDTSELKCLPYSIPFKLRWSQFTNRRSVRSKLAALLKDFHFITMEEACRLLASELHVSLDLAPRPVAYGNVLLG